MDFRDVRDESVDDVINHVLRALHNPRHVSSTGSTNDLHHLLVEFGPLIPPATAEDPVIVLIETIVRESTPTNSRAPSTRNSLHESPSILSTDSRKGFWSKLFKRRSQKSTEGFQDTTEGSYDPAEPSKYSLPSIGSGNDSNASASALKAAENHVAQLEDSGPGDLTSVSALGREINRRICVWSSSMTLRHEVGSGRSGDPINLQFHSQPEDVIGHWSLVGNEDPQGPESGLNDCLFNAIAAQTGHKPSDLRDITVARMRTNIRSVANRIQELARREECDRIVLMVGGARYHGSTARDAGRVIDNSQRGHSHPNHAHGHPRGHASNPSATGPNDSAENYSRNGWKTAFLSPEDQDDVGNRVLRTRQVQRAMEALNAGGVRQVVRVDASEVEGQLPQGAHFNDGRRGQVQEIRDLVLVLQHHAGHQRDPDYDVFVHTFYPVLRGLNEPEHQADHDTDDSTDKSDGFSDDTEMEELSSSSESSES